MFRLNKLTDYGIVLMAHVARSPEETPHTARSLAKETRLPLPTVGKLLRKLGYRRLSVRPRHPRADPVAQEDFKKNSSRPSPRSYRPEPWANPSKSGSRTKRASASRAR